MTRTWKLRGLWVALALAIFSSGMPARPAGAQSQDLFNNFNIGGVVNRPRGSTVFRLNAPARVTELVTYHWNHGRGVPQPGTIALRNDSNGQFFGPFPARGSAGQGGVPNANWVASTNVTVPAGTYTVIDSDPKTWAQNPQSFSRGFAIVRGAATSAPTAGGCPTPPAVFIRGIRYADYSRTTSLSTTAVSPGGFFQVRSNCLPYDGRVVVTLQDVTRGNGFGVTAFQLTNVSTNGTVLTAQAPNLPIFRNRTYQVAVFVFGQPAKTANPGQLTVR